jgi:hypothetical protein
MAWLPLRIALIEPWTPESLAEPGAPTLTDLLYVGCGRVEGVRIGGRNGDATHAFYHHNPAPDGWIAPPGLSSSIDPHA